MGDDIRIGVEPPSAPPPRSGKLIAVLAGIILLAGAGAWLAGALHEPSSPTTTLPSPEETTTTDARPTATGVPAGGRPQALAFWTHLAAGEADAALAAVPDPDPGAADLIAFVAAFNPDLQADDCREFAADAVECLVTVTDEDLLAIGRVGGTQRLLLSADGRFDLPAVLASAASRLSLHALNIHTEDVQAACPLTDEPPVAGLAIVGSPTAACGAYLVGLIPEYLGGGDTINVP